MAQALKAVENKYFYGEADPNNKLENGDTLFEFLVNADLAKAEIGESLSAEMYELASKMVPGGVDFYRYQTEIVKGKTVVRKDLPKIRVPGSIRAYLPDILKALRDVQPNDTDMIMMALGTIRAETAAFKPISEGVSKYNTSPGGTKGHHDFDLYDFRNTGKNGLGNNAVGHGALYKGRGFVQLTGRSNYITYGTILGVDLLNDPELANDPIVAAKLLARFIKKHEAECRKAIAANDLALARRLVNGGSHGKAEFVSAFDQGRKYLGIVVVAQAKRKSKPKVKAVPKKK